jgi:hypothetical protein
MTKQSQIETALIPIGFNPDWEPATKRAWIKIVSNFSKARAIAFRQPRVGLTTWREWLAIYDLGEGWVPHTLEKD